jgi:xanthine dehydrogenase YagR molybdenum-binding subunit
VTRPLPAALVTGQPVARVDGRLKVTGRARYAADNPAPNMVYAALVTSTVARGSVERIEPASAVRHPDVLRVLTDFGGVKLPYDIRQVSCFGQAVAIVVATSLEAAMHGASLVEVRYRTATQTTDIDAPQAQQKSGSRTRDYSRGDADAALRTAAVVTDIRYSIERNNHSPMEIPATVASWDGDQLTVWDKVQSISSAQQAYADAFGMPVGNVRVISPFVGGAFGSAGTTWPHQLLAAFAARQMRRPVKLALTRKQYYSGIGFRPTSRQRLAIGADRSGRIGSIVHEAHTETSRYSAYEDNLMTGARFLYSAPNMRSTYRIVPLTSTHPPTCVAPALRPALP